ncbi:MAG TPA: hypothetical protein VFC24_17695 [Casimicrobiaceae bacterium]|nr:hypothetical protein [Casimicrobiaceae bacterium]
MNARFRAGALLAVPLLVLASASAYGAPLNAPAIPSSALHSPAAAPATADTQAPLRIVDPQDGARRTRATFRITIATAPDYANRIATVTVQQIVAESVPGAQGFGVPGSRVAKWDVPVSRLLQGWSPPPINPTWDWNAWYANISGDALVSVSLAIPHGTQPIQQLQAQTHVTFVGIEQTAPAERTSPAAHLQTANPWPQAPVGVRKSP